MLPLKPRLLQQVQILEVTMLASLPTTRCAQHIAKQDWLLATNYTAGKIFMPSTKALHYTELCQMLALTQQLSWKANAYGWFYEK